MPEYLAPGVYVEETSFRSKSIEGVSTSTTAFVGFARKGPVTDNDRSPTPELVTSYVDFERIFGGFEDVELGGARTTNYLAHAVNAFFANGGSRLYVARVAGGDAKAAESATFLDGNAKFKARFVGQAGSGRVVLSLSFAPLTERTWKTAPVGTVVRLGGGPPPTAAHLTGEPRSRFSVPAGASLSLTVNGTAQSVTFRGAPARAVAHSPLDGPRTLDATNNKVEVDIDGLLQTIELTPGTDVAPEKILTELNEKLAGGFVSRDASNHLVITTDSRGSASKIKVKAAPVLGFTGDRSAENTAGADNNVKNLLQLDLDDIKNVLQPLDLVVTQSADGALVLATKSSGGGAGIVVAAGQAQAGLGLPTAAAAGAAGTTVSYAVKDVPDKAFPSGAVDAISLAITAIDRDGHARVYEDLGLDHRHPRFVGEVLSLSPGRRSEQLENLVYLDLGTGSAVDGAAWAEALVGASAPFARVGAGTEADRLERQIELKDGTDGNAPTSAAYRTAFGVLERLEDISIVAAPGYSALAAQADAIEAELLIHVEKRRAYRIGVLDSRPGQSLGEVRTSKSRIDSKYAALYYPWVVVQNPLWQPGDARIPREIPVPPSGFACGIYARSDVERGVFKAPANEIVRGALRFETDVNFAQQEVLNPLGVNCLRFLSGRGYRVWGARTTSSDPEWKYVSIRRYFNYVERSIDVGTQWAVFEPNGERLWANVRETISSFLYGEWRSGALLGTDPKEAYFVRCDRSTMDQNDLDNGRLVCLIGMAVVKPAEFVVFRIGQKTADARS
ncbi:phage tail sheath family protein [Sorangium sp. So ce1389]|uniref:phage tail sheath family protein n=1 Tax=Sorangium sp. So ce1389 TaxID=3133336 RepID=UPI003F5E0F3A